MGGGTNMKKLLYVLLSLSLLMTTSCSFSKEDPTIEDNAQPIVLQLAELHISTYPTTVACDYFAKLVEERTEGRVKIDVYSQGRLGTELETIEKVKAGSIDFARINCAPLSEYSPNITPVTLPFTFDSDTHLENALSSELGDEMLNNMTEPFKGLAWYYSGSRCFYFNTPIDKVEQIQGKKIRIQNSEIMSSLITSLGANPVKLDWADIYNKIEDGSIDGAENDVVSYESAVHNAVAPYYLLDRHSFTPSILLTSTATFDKLSNEDAEILRQCAKESQTYEFELWREYEQASMEALKDEGVTFLPLSQEEQSKLMELVHPLYEKYASEYADELEKISSYK